MQERKKKTRPLPHPFQEIVENDAKRSDMQNSGVIPMKEYQDLMEVRNLLTRTAQDVLKPAGAGRTA